MNPDIAEKCFVHRTKAVTFLESLTIRAIFSFASKYRTIKTNIFTKIYVTLGKQQQQRQFPQRIFGLGNYKQDILVLEMLQKYLDPSISAAVIV